jgi:hypothetical protein
VTQRDVPGSELLHPAAIAALLVLIVNDHVLKGGAVPTVVTGKLSDLAGLAIAPLVLTATVAWGRAAMRRPPVDARRAAWIAAAATAVAFAAIKLSPTAMDVFREALGLAQWLPSAAWAAVSGSASPSIPDVSAVVDPTDLLALPACLLAPWVAGTVPRPE